MAFDDCASACLCTRTYSTLSAVCPQSHRFLHFPSLFPHLVHFSPACRSKMNQPICHPLLPPLSVSFPPPVYLVVLSYSIISHVNHSLHLLSSYFQCSLISNIYLHFFPHVGLSATAPKSDMSDHKFKSQECKWWNLWKVNGWEKKDLHPSILC